VSGDRADNARATLINFGVTAQRFSRIVGKGDTVPVHPSFPKAMRNNRVSVLLLNKPIGKAAAVPGNTNVAADR
jgi:chemotaxis protein MotB